MGVEELMQLYRQSAQDFRTCLANGTPWEDVQELRLQVHTLEMELFKKLKRGAQNPAEFRNR